MKLFSNLRNWQASRETAKQLNSLSAHQLNDLGLNRIGSKYFRENGSQI